MGNLNPELVGAVLTRFRDYFPAAPGLQEQCRFWSQSPNPPSPVQEPCLGDKLEYCSLRKIVK